MRGIVGFYAEELVDHLEDKKDLLVRTTNEVHYSKIDWLKWIAEGITDEYSFYTYCHQPEGDNLLIIAREDITDFIDCVITKMMTDTDDDNINIEVLHDIIYEGLEVVSIPLTGTKASLQKN